MRSSDVDRGFSGMNRRDFLLGSAAAAAVSAMSPWRPRKTPQPAPSSIASAY